MRKLGIAILGILAVLLIARSIQFIENPAALAGSLVFSLLVLAAAHYVLLRWMK